MLRTEFPSASSFSTSAARCSSTACLWPIQPNSFRSLKVFSHLEQRYLCIPSGRFPDFLQAIRQLWHVTVKSPVEFHSRKPDNRFACPYGFGCMDQGVLAAIRDSDPWAMGLTAYRFTAGCVRPLCQPAKEVTKGQQFPVVAQGLLAFFLLTLSCIIKKEYRHKGKGGVDITFL